MLFFPPLEVALRIALDPHLFGWLVLLAAYPAIALYCEDPFAGESEEEHDRRQW